MKKLLFVYMCLILGLSQLYADNDNAGILDLYDFKDTFEIKIRTHDFDYYSIFIETI